MIKYFAALYDQYGAPIVKTEHKTESSRQAELFVMQRRIERGTPNAGGQIPTRCEKWEGR